MRAHPIERWPIPTFILRGEADTLSEREEVDAFCKTFHTHLTEMPGGEHHFHTVEQLAFFRSWLQEVLW